MIHPITQTATIPIVGISGVSNLQDIYYFHAYKLLRDLYDLIYVNQGDSPKACEIKKLGRRVWLVLSHEQREKLVDESFYLQQVNIIVAKISTSIKNQVFSDEAEIELSFDEIEVNVDEIDAVSYVY
jgi:hypothetical protein